MKLDEIILPRKCIRGVINLPGDKSLAHRALILASISNGKTVLKNFPFSKACMATLECMRELGVEIETNRDTVFVVGRGLYGLKPPKKILQAGDSGTTLRLLLGLLSAQKFDSKISCGDTLKKRPMDRVLNPLSKMGAKINRVNESLFEIKSVKDIFPVEYKMPVASAQVKSAILLASLYCKGKSKIIEPLKSRDHTENMINYFGGSIERVGNEIISCFGGNLSAKSFFIPSDVSSAAFFIVLATVFAGAHIMLNNVLLNERRNGLVKVLREMGADIRVKNIYQIYENESICDIEVFNSPLSAIKISGQTVVDMIDEVPIFVVAALFAKGKSVVSDASELHVKESNRILSLVEEFNKFGAKIEPKDDGMIIEGEFSSLENNFPKFDSHFDHRLAMSLIVFSFAIGKKITINGMQSVADSFPDFLRYMYNFV